MNSCWLVNLGLCDVWAWGNRGFCTTLIAKGYTKMASAFSSLLLVQVSDSHFGVEHFIHPSNLK